MAASFVVCIDESGDQGFTFSSPDCSRWFILTAIVGLRGSTAGMSQTLRKIKSEIGWKQNKPLHFKRVKPEANRMKTIQILAEDGHLFRSVSVLIHKPCITSPEKFQEENRLYFFATRMLLERVSWLCRDSKEMSKKEYGDGTADVIFSNMNEVSKAQLCNYFSRLKNRDTQIDWSIIDQSRFATMSPGKNSGLQIADIVAGSFFCAEHRLAERKTSEWLEILKHTVYRSSRGRYRGYGVKIFPQGTETRIAQGTLAPWAVTLFPD